MPSHERDRISSPPARLVLLIAAVLCVAIPAIGLLLTSSGLLESRRLFSKLLLAWVGVSLATVSYITAKVGQIEELPFDERRYSHEKKLRQHVAIIFGGFTAALVVGYWLGTVF